jgi:hypothetical protein
MSRRKSNVDGKPAKTEAQYGENSKQTDNRIDVQVAEGAHGIVIQLPDTSQQTERLLRASRTSNFVNGFATAVALVAACVSWWNIKEAKQVQIQLMYANAIMLREGLVQPGDMVYGPEGNLEYRQHELKRKGK